MYLISEEKEVGKANFCAAIASKAVRRDFLKKQVNDSLSSKKGLGAYYYGYGKVSDPVRVAVIGTGDEGSVLIGALNPDYMQVKAIADIRPYSVWRAFNGEWYTPSAQKVRLGLMAIYKWNNEDAARKEVKVYGAYQELLENAKQDGIEAVIIALPLHLHAPCAIAAMKAGLHVITEKLMAHSVHECKEMARFAKEKDLYLAVGHQRHYNILYDNSVELIRKGALGELHSIRAQWHRNNQPGSDTWQVPMPRKLKEDDLLASRLEEELAKWEEKNVELLKQVGEVEKEEKDEKKAKALISELNKKIAALAKQIAQKQAQISDGVIDAAKYGYTDLKLPAEKGAFYNRPAAEELIRWRLWNRTGGGLMAELGSHQLDASCIFVAAAHAAKTGDAGKNGLKPVHPLNVSAAGNRPLFPVDRDCEDHVYCIFEFPSPDYDPKDPNRAKKKIGVQYASINGNVFGGYGETVLGTQGTLVLETEQDAMLFRGSDTKGKAQTREKDKRAVLAPLDPAKPDEAAERQRTEAMALGILATLPAERGYAEELEHFAWCIRNKAPENKPRCDGAKAMGDAVIALVTNMAARKGERKDFNPEWFEVDSDETPEGEKPDLSRYND